MKFGRMMNYNKIQVPFEDEIDRVDRTQTSPKRVVKIDINCLSLNISKSSQYISFKFHIKVRYSNLYNSGKF